MKTSRYLDFKMDGKILKEDIQQFAEHFELWEMLRGKSFLITGATGLIGSILVKCLIRLDEQKRLGIRINAIVRDVDKAKVIFQEYYDAIHFHELSLDKIELEDHFASIDYIIHLASPTNGKYMELHPVETFSLAVESTKNLLELARQTGCKGFVYVSSLEYYGQILEDRLITEEVQGYLDGQNVRSSYPIGKRAAEYLCYAYSAEYSIPVKIARLTQTFGAGVSASENRVFAQFVRSIIKSDDIILHTNGDSAKPYCYTIDCISALLIILLFGNSGEAYNVANDDTYISIKCMAEYLKEHFNPAIDVRIELNDNMGYAPVTKLKLSSEKLRNLGWKPKYELKEMFSRLMEYMKEQQYNVL